MYTSKYEQHLFCRIALPRLQSLCSRRALPARRGGLKSEDSVDADSLGSQADPTP